MKIKNIDEIDYKLPGGLNYFQEEMYVHLINKKWEKISKTPGIYKYKGRKIEYDAILPEDKIKDLPIIYPSIRSELDAHKEKYEFKYHPHFNHVASSQAANINLFLPILTHPRVNEVLSFIKDDFKKLNTDDLYKGFRLEYWDGNSDEETGLLGDHNPRSGTDADLAISYINKNDEQCLWLIEHKLVEAEFTECGGFTSKKNTNKINCSKSFSDILSNKNYCYYHDVKKNNYWKITEENKTFFVNADSYNGCPFKNGMNQLWRNQLLGFGLEKKSNYKEVYFTVVKHPANNFLNKTLDAYKKIIKHTPKFSILTSKKILDEAAKLNDKKLNEWISWYSDMYKV